MEKYYLLGFPLGHSISPFLHSRLFEISGRKASFELLQSPTIDSVLEKLLSADGFCVTIPYKTDIMAHLASLDNSALTAGAVNVVDKNKCGYNTDVYGFRKNIENLCPKLQGNILLLGLGGVGKAFAVEALKDGANLTVAVREPSKEIEGNNFKFLKSSFPNAVINLVPISDILSLGGNALREFNNCKNSDCQHSHFDLLINSTPVGMYPNADCPISKEVLPFVDAIFDCVYNPKTTPLLAMASKAGIPNAGGLAMLVHQAAKAHFYWYGTEFCNKELEILITDCKKMLH